MKRLHPLVALLACLAMPAWAQTADQTALEQLFGEPVTTSATGKPQRVSEVPVDMEIVTAADIRRTGANNIPDVLQFVPGVDVRRYGRDDVAIGIRGYNTALNPRVLVLLDGRQVYEDDYGMTVWSLIPVTMSEIRQIEIIKGPNAALYGFNAVSGVINIVTYDPLRDPVNAARVDLGTQNATYGEATSTMQIPDRLGVRISAKGFRATEFEGSEGYNSREQPHNGMVATDVRVKLSPDVEWDVAASIGSVDSDYYVDIGEYLPLGFKANSVSSRLTADTAIGMLQLYAYRNENRTSNSYALFAENWRQDVSVVQASDVMKFGNHTLRAAFEYRDNSASSLQAFSGRIGYTNIAGSLMWDWRVLRWLSLTNAIRVDDLSLTHIGAQFTVPTVGGVYHNATIVQPSFNSGAVIRLSDDDTIRLTAARAVQLPSLFDFGFANNAAGAFVTGNTGLTPSVITNYEFDYDRALPAWGSTLRLSAFSQRSDTTIGSPFGSGITVLPTGQPWLQTRNFGDSTALGGEIGLKGSSGGLHWAASYALAAVHDDTARSVLLATPSVSYQRQTPTHSVILAGGYSEGPFEIDIQGRWQSHFEDFSINPTNLAFREVVVANYVTVNARLAYRLTDHATIALVGNQLNQQRLTESAGLQVDRRLLASLTVKF